MPDGFFAKSELLVSRQPIPLVARCEACQLYTNGCHSPKTARYGQGKRGILIIGEGNGKVEDQQGKPFRGPTGRFLRDTLRKFDVEMDRDCWLYNAIACRASGAEIKDRSPTDAEISYCRPNVIRTITELQPTVIILLGGAAIKSVMGWLWKEDSGSGGKGGKKDVGKVGRWDGWQIPSCRLNSWICSTWHPSFVNRQDEGKEGPDPLRQLFFEDHLERAVSLTNRPWNPVPDWSKKITRIYDAEDAARMVRKFTSSNKPTSIDIETNMLKPDSEAAQIVSCSLSDGKTTISFPWYGAVVETVKEFVVSRVPKLLWAGKFESRWIKSKLGVWMRNWGYDGMIGTHVLDNRSAICSLKFQAFTELGVEPYDSHIKPYLEAKTSNGPNRIRELDLPGLLLYGGLDALFEAKIDLIQAERLGVKFEQVSK